MGIQTKLSWLSPKTLPFFSATPTILKGRPSSSTSLPRGSMEPKKASTRSVPTTATARACSMSFWIEVAARGRSRTLPMRGMFSVIPVICDVVLA